MINTASKSEHFPSIWFSPYPLIRRAAIFPDLELVHSVGGELDKPGHNGMSARNFAANLLFQGQLVGPGDSLDRLYSSLRHAVGLRVVDFGLLWNGFSLLQGTKSLDLFHQIF